MGLPVQGHIFDCQTREIRRNVTRYTLREEDAKKVREDMRDEVLTCGRLNELLEYSPDYDLGSGGENSF